MSIVDPAPIFPFAMADALPLSLADAELDGTDLPAFEAFLATRRGAAPALVGGYDQIRRIYSNPQFLGDGEPRIVHLGVDVWTDGGTPLAAPLAGTVHSFADNAATGDYGATIILQHEGFCTLWGHLARRSLQDLVAGAPVARGETFAWLGEPAENGGWPPHLHLQQILDMGDHRGNHPGVATLSDRQSWLRRCPDPSMLLV